MKKVLASVVIMLVGFSSFAQKSEVFENGTNVVNLGVGLGNIYWGSDYSRAPVSFNASYDRGVSDKLGIGYIGLGGTFSYTSAKYTVGSYTYRNSGVLFGARASYHFSIANEIGEKLDPYAGVILGYVVTSHSTDDPTGDYRYGYKSGGVYPGFFAGAHYYFVPSFGVYAEVGYNIVSILNTGITFKFYQK
jgi:hypothetical protein